MAGIWDPGRKNVSAMGRGQADRRTGGEFSFPSGLDRIMLCLTTGRSDQNGVVACTHLCPSLGRTHDAGAVLGLVEEISPPMIVVASMIPFPPTFLP